eukprot:1146309-Pelagomonas_calceolata.AAC.8
MKGPLSSKQAAADGGGNCKRGNRRKGGMSTGRKTYVLPQERTKEGGHRQSGMSLAYAQKSLSTTIYKPFTPNEFNHVLESLLYGLG